MSAPDQGTNQGELLDRVYRRLILVTGAVVVLAGVVIGVAWLVAQL